MKRRNNKGFTLIEMLIVVGIIAILVAVSIPMVNSSLERTKIATDAANERAAKAAAMIEFLQDGVDLNAADYAFYYYDAVSGTVIDAYNDPGAADGSPSLNDPPKPYGKCAKHKDGYLMVSILSDGRCEMNWLGDGIDQAGASTHMDNGDLN